MAALDTLEAPAMPEALVIVEPDVHGSFGDNASAFVGDIVAGVVEVSERLGRAGIHLGEATLGELVGSAERIHARNMYLANRVICFVSLSPNNRHNRSPKVSS